MFRKISTIIAATAISLLASLTPFGTVNAAPAGSVNNFYFKDFTAAYYLWRDDSGTSRMRVVENLTAVFPTYGQNHGITRVIPFTNQGGTNLTMQSDDKLHIDVKRNGQTESINEVEVGDGYFQVYIGDADEYVTGEQTYTLTYEFENVITSYEDAEQEIKAWQELYWDTNGNDWSQRFEQVTARVYLDESIADKFDDQTACHVGTYGESGEHRCTIRNFTDEVDLGDGRKSLGGIEFSAQNLKARENLTFVIGFAANTFAQAPERFDYRLVIAVAVAAVLGIGMIFLMIKCYTATAEKRNYYKNLFVKPEYTPLADVTVAEMAENYIGKGLKGDSKVATLLDLAIHHQIEMIKTEKDGLLGKKKTEWKIRVKTDTLNTQQATVLKILAGSSSSLKVDQEITVKPHTATSALTKLLTKFAESVKENLIKKSLAVDLETKHLKTQRPTNWSNILLSCGAVWLIVGVLSAPFIFADIPPYVTVLGEEYLSIIYIALLVGIAFASFAIGAKTSIYLSHTQKGLDASRYLEGLRLYMEMAESDRLKMLQSVQGADTSHEGVVKLYEKLLPYAVLFKLEESWLNELARYYEFDDVAAPTWYIGMGVFSARDFSAAMISASSSMSSTIAHSTTSSSSSGSSGFGGGGFSGGGGGGGGGGGW